MPLCHNELILYFDMLHCRPGGEEGLHCASADRSGHEAGYPGGRLLHHGQLGRSGPQDWPQLRTRRTAGLQVLEYVGEDVLTKSHPALGAGGGGGLSQVFSSAGSIPPHPPLKRSCACVWCSPCLVWHPRPWKMRTAGFTVSETPTGLTDCRFVKWLSKNRKLQGIPPSAFFSQDHKYIGEDYIRFCFIKVKACPLLKMFWVWERNAYIMMRIRIRVHIGSCWIRPDPGGKTYYLQKFSQS